MENWTRSRATDSSNTSPPSTVRSNDGTNPATEALQEMIREKRAATTRSRQPRPSLSRGVRGDRFALEDQQIQSSPLGPVTRRDRSSTGSRRSSGAVGKPATQKEMGLREMQDVSEISLSFFS